MPSIWLAPLKLMNRKKFTLFLVCSYSKKGKRDIQLWVYGELIVEL